MTTRYTKKDLMAPQKQVLIFCAAAVLGMLGARFIARDTLTIWLIGVTCLLLFSIMNNGMSFFAEDYKSYIVRSVYSFLLLLLIVVGGSTYLSGTDIYEAGAYRIIIIMVLMANFLFMAMITTVKGLLELLENKDESP